MQWRNVAGRVLSFVIGAAAIVLVTFVALPWLQGRDEPANQPMSGAGVTERALASFGEDAGPDGEMDRQAAEQKDAMNAPWPLPQAPDEHPASGPGIEPWAAPGFEELNTRSAQGAGVHETLSPVELEAVVSERRQTATVSPGEVDSGQAPLDRLPEEGEAVEASSSAEDVDSTVEESPASVATGVMDMAESIPGELVPAAPVRDAEPLRKKAVRHSEPALQSSRAGLRRLEFEMPDNPRFAEPPQGAGYMPEGTEPTAPVAPLSEFSPRRFSRSVLPAAEAVEPPAGSGEQDEIGRAEPALVPGTLRGVMGYRLPLISRQELPDQVVSGVLIPAHTTYVILEPGYWELVGLSPDEATATRAAADKGTAGELSADSEPDSRGWNPFRLFRTKRPPGAQK